MDCCGCLLILCQEHNIILYPNSCALKRRRGFKKLLLLLNLQFSYVGANIYDLFYSKSMLIVTNMLFDIGLHNFINVFV